MSKICTVFRELYKDAIRVAQSPNVSLQFLCHLIVLSNLVGVCYSLQGLLYDEFPLVL
jgi:hypothetical protein